MIQERRTHQRAKKHLMLKIADKGFDVITETVNISPSGTYCRVTRHLPIMSKIEVVVLVPAKGKGGQAKKIKCKGVVVRTEPVILPDADRAHYNIAIFFTDITKKDRESIEAYVNTGTVEDEKIQMLK